MSVLDPTNMCYYISEVLDAGRDGPLFMVLDLIFLLYNHFRPTIFIDVMMCPLEIISLPLF